MSVISANDGARQAHLNTLPWLLTAGHDGPMAGATSLPPWSAGLWKGESESSSLAVPVLCSNESRSMARARARSLQYPFALGSSLVSGERVPIWHRLNEIVDLGYGFCGDAGGDGFR